MIHIRQDKRVIELLDCSDSLLFQQRCYDRYVHPKTLQTLKKKNEKSDTFNENETPGPSTLRSSDRKKDRSTAATVCL